MTRYLSIIILTLYSFCAISQTKMRPLKDLIDEKDPGWTLVKKWINSAKNKVEILPVDSIKAKDALYKIQVTTRSPMGAIVYMTGGLLIDNGWIRILGSGSKQLNRTLPDWNKGKGITEYGTPTPFILIADDAIGGFFLLNGGGLGADLGKIYYLSPDSLEFEALNLTYSTFLEFCFNGDIDSFYKGYRWKNWKNEVSKLEGDKVFNFYPFLWSKEGKNIEKNSRKAISIEEQYNLNLDFRKQLGLDNQ